MGAVTLLSMQSEMVSAGQSRFQTQALYAAESGVSAGIDYLSNSWGGDFKFSASISANNAAPPVPTQLLGNGIRPGQTGNLFSAGTDLWYEVAIYNNVNDTGFATGIDDDGVVILRSTGHGPDNTTAVIEVQVYNGAGMSNWCAQEFAQRNLTSRNDARAMCGEQVDATAVTRTITPGGP